MTGAGLGIGGVDFDGTACMHDVAEHLMDRFGDEYQEILSMPSPPLETMAGAAEASELARIGNDGFAELIHVQPAPEPTHGHLETAGSLIGQEGDGLAIEDRGLQGDSPDRWGRVCDRASLRHRGR